MAIVYKENQRLYLNNWEFNAARVLTEMAKIIKECYGRVKPLYHALVSNRSKDDNKVIEVTHTSYIDFIYDGHRFYYQLDDNPFFDFIYSKVPIKDEVMYSRDVYCDKDDKAWVSDDLICGECTDEEIHGYAKTLFFHLIRAKDSEVYREKKRIQVPNVYSSGYHYETVYRSERFAQLDF